MTEKEASAMNPLTWLTKKFKLQILIPINMIIREINCWVKKELDVLCQQLLEYNEKTFGKFM
ncbi:hypothetical protein Glove_180g113 [Diversispora epigaea]|uniref:Uncharacterized protein n=1 Tax=Diversispora epigaea TaxID=1348612 RepID=A0A397IN91_9GLOM|nr:hypothetical protein Glove_180g113 [Diversispora epigaea]